MTDNEIEFIRARRKHSEVARMCLKLVEEYRAMRPVVEAAVKWRNAIEGTDGRADSAAHADLLIAIDAYRKAQEASK